ncbi:SMP-30/Gluconolaconase/LRE-like region-domain-containing protein [Poronia punctata]|nr:SMP-30/Gluconolaconase/LRE-like region-domain-containing protein [Poronia punctata]
MSTTTTTKPDFQEWNVTEPYLHLHCALSEGPYYERESNSLRFVDIKKHRVHWVNLSEGPNSVTTTQLDVPVTVTADIEGVDPREKILIGVKHGIAVLDRKSGEGKYEYVARFFDNEEEGKRLRSNDGAADPNGRFWLGSMTDIGLDLRAEGHLHLFNPGSPKAQSIKHPLTIPNALTWSPDGKTMYFTHSTAKTIYAFDYDTSADGSLSNERVFYQHVGKGEPDGCRVDVEGNLWHAVYGEARVLKISKEGELIGQVNLPTDNITCTQFVGTELFITTAKMEEGGGDGDGDEERVRLSGAVYKVDVGVEGLEPFKVKLEL